MATFPTGIADGLHSPVTDDTIAATDVSALVTEILAIEAKVGADGSGVITSHDYLLTHLPAQAGDWDAGGYEIRASTFESDVVGDKTGTGTAPMTIASSKLVSNLNADLLDGVEGSGYQTILTNSAGLRAALADPTGTGAAVFATSPTLVTPTLGAALATSVNGLIIDTTTGTLDITNAKTLTVTGDATISATPYTPSGTDVAIADGGTGQSTADAALDALLPSQTGNANKFLQTDGAGGATWQTVDLTTDITGALPVANGGTGSTSAANARTALGLAIGTDVLAPTGDGSGLTGITAVTGVTDTDTGTTYDDDPEVTFLTKAKSITNGKTVLLIASGYVQYAGNSETTIKLKQGATTVQTIIVQTTESGSSGCSTSAMDKVAWSCCAIVTGLSGSITFTVTAQKSTSGNGTAYGNLCVLEF